MPLIVVTGRANAGKTGVLYRAVQRSARNGGSPVVLVPTFPDVERAEREFAERHLYGARIAVFESWCAEQWAAHGDGRRFVTDQARRALVSQVVAERTFEHIAASAARPGFVELIARIVKHAGAHDALGARGGDPRLEEVAAIVADYGRALARHGLVEPTVAMGVLAATPPRNDGPIAINRFVDFSVAQERLIYGLASVSEVYVALTWEQGHAATHGTSALVERFMTRGARLEVIPQPPAEGELDLVESALYRPGEAIVTTGAVRVLHAGGPEDEVAAVMEAVGRMVADGIGPERIAVAFRDPPRRLHLLRTLAAAQEAPVRIEVLTSASDLPLCAAFLAALDWAQDGEAARERLLAFANSPYSGATLDDAAALDARWRRTRPDGPELLRSARALGPRASRALVHAQRIARTGSAKPSSWQKLADMMLEAARERHPAGTSAAMEDAACHEAIASVVLALSEVCGGTAGLADVRSELRALRIPVEYGTEGPAVVVTEAHRLHSRRFDALVIAGLSAEEFSPGQKTSLAREIARSLGADETPDEAERERALFYTLVTRAARHLVLVDPTAVPGADSMRRSCFVDDVLDLYRSPAERAAGEGPVHGPPGRTEQSSDEEEAERLAEQDQRELRRRIGPIHWGGGDVAAAGTQDREYTVSELETYLACPFRWFVQYALRVKPLDRTFGPAETGSLSHEALAAFYREWTRKRGQERVEPETVHDALALLDEVWGPLRERYGVRDLAERHLLEQAYRRVRGVVADDAEAFPGFIPVEHEFRFGRAEGRPFEIGGCSIRGSIDRIDAGDTGVIVADYKSGSRVAGHESFASECLLQLPVYAAVAERCFGAPVAAIVYRSLATLQVRGAWNPVRVDLRSRGVRTDALDDETLARVIAEGESRAAAALEGIRSGVVEQTPAADACRFCPVAPVCDREERAWRYN